MANHREKIHDRELIYRKQYTNEKKTDMPVKKWEKMGKYLNWHFTKKDTKVSNK